jgi:hypothetical protein
MGRARERSVKHLQNVLVMLTSIAASIAIVRVTVVSGDTVSVRWNQLPLLFCLFVTIIPFYHGASRHLERNYVELTGKGIRRGAVILDSGMLFLEGLILTFLANAVSAPEPFVWAFLALLLLDAFWGFLAHLAFTHENQQNPEATWAVINLAAAVVLTIAMVFLRPHLALREPLAQAAVAGIGVLRTVAGYWRCWAWYFPEA